MYNTYLYVFDELSYLWHLTLPGQGNRHPTPRLGVIEVQLVRIFLVERQDYRFAAFS